ncbi:tape measure protein [Mycobacterium phage Refuge]|uniref:Tape measure protein n=1 Tax=Mycobacterium phage Refuge TaxID=2517967 RepID=A0A482JFM4_9CAUD|nr:tail length tape measure protein [Mycobacterium phage Refuge]QBP31049.1 tape measure protein [Mycobacterium phage Refuge]
MAGAGGTEVGRISIRVSPDTDKFRRELKEQLEAIEKGEEGNVPVNVEVDTAKALTDFRAMLATMRAEGRQGVTVEVNQNRGSAGAGRPNGGSATNDTTDIDRAVRDSTASIGRWAAAWREARGGIADTGRAIRLAAQGTREYNAGIRESVYQMQQQRPLLNHTYADIKARIAKMREFTDALKQQQQWMRQDDRTLSANAARWKSWMMAVRDSNEHATSAVKRFGASFKALRGGGGDGEGSGILSSLTRMFRGSGDEAENAGQKFAQSGQKILGMSRMMAITVGVFALAAPAIGLVATALAALPSLVSAFAAGGGAIALGLDGIKKAIEPLNPLLDAMKAKVSAVFEERLAPMVAQVSKMMGPLGDGMATVANGLSNMFQGVVDAFSSDQGIAQLNTMLANSAGLFSMLQGPMNTLSTAWINLSTAGSQSFGNLSGTIENFANGFNEAVNSITSSGALGSALDSLKMVTDSAGNLFNKLLVSGVEAMGKMGPSMSTFIDGFGNLLISLMPALTSFSSLIMNVLGTLGTALAPVITALTPAFTMLADTLGTLLTSSLTTLSPVLTQVAQLLGGAITTALQALAPMLPGLIQSFAQLATTIVSQLAPYIPQLATAFGQIVGAVLQLVPVIVGSLVPAFIQLVPAIVQLVPPIVSLVQSFVQMLPVIMPVIQIIIQLAAAFIQVGVSVGGALLGALSSLLGILAEVSAKVAEWVSGFAQGASDIAAKAAELPGMVKSALGDLGSFLVSSGKALVSGFIDGIKSMFGAVKDAASGLMNAVKSFFPHSPAPEGPFSGSGWTAVGKSGEAIGGAFADGIGNSQAGVLDQVRQLMQVAKSVFGDGPMPQLNFNFGQAQQQVAGLSSGITDLKTDMSSLASDTASNPALGAPATGDLKKQADMLEMKKKELEIEAKKADIEAKQATDDAAKKAAQARAKDLRLQKDQLGLQLDQLKYQKQYGDQADDINTVMGEALGKTMGVPVDFAKATSSQFLSDIGISGNGLVSKALTEGIKYVFNIGSVDEAMDIKDRQEKTQSLTVTGRQ